MKEVGYRAETILMKYDDLEKIVPRSWKRIDDKQFAVCPLSEYEFKVFKGNAKKYAISTM